MRIFLILIVSSLIPLRIAWADCSRIISLAPSITEILYELELNEQIVAVTNYDRYPADVQSKARIGGFLDLNLEGIISLKPSVVVGLEEHSEFSKKLKALGLEVLLLNHGSVNGIIESLNITGKYCHKAEVAAAKANQIQNQIADIKKTSNKLNPKVLVTVGRNLETPSTRSFFISGNDGFYDNLIEIAGGTNVIKEKTIFSGTLSAESLLKLNPDIIIEILGRDSSANITEEQVKASWQQLSSLTAVQSNNIYVIKKDYADIPGPRFVLLLNDFTRILSEFK